MNIGEERLVERRVTYSLEHNGKFYIVEGVPARSMRRRENNFSPLKLSNGYKNSSCNDASRPESSKHQCTNTPSDLNPAPIFTDVLWDYLIQVK